MDTADMPNDGGFSSEGMVEEPPSSHGEGGICLAIIFVLLYLVVMVAATGGH
jgi:hypothetical protein